MSLSTFLLADAVSKGGPGSGPQGGKKETTVQTGSGKSSLVTIHDSNETVPDTATEWRFQGRNSFASKVNDTGFPSVGHALSWIKGYASKNGTSRDHWHIHPLPNGKPIVSIDFIRKGGPGSGPQSGQGLSPFKDHSGKRVTINNPGSSVHGVTGRILRQVGNESAIDTGGDQTIWAKTEHLREA